MISPRSHPISIDSEFENEKDTPYITLQEFDDIGDDLSIFSDESSMGTVEHDSFVKCESLHRNFVSEKLPQATSPISMTVSFPTSKLSGSSESAVSSLSRRYNSPKPSSTQNQSLDFDEESNLLHAICCAQPESISCVMSAIVADPESLGKRRLPYLNGNSSHANKKRRVEQIRAFPINIAVKYKASMDVLALLVNASPDVLILPDGPDACASLSLALRERPNDLSLVDLLLTANPQCAQVHDRHRNYPLQIACYKRSSLEVVEHIHNSYPEALGQRNINGETPLMIAQRSGRCPKEVLDFLSEEADKALQSMTIDF